MKISIIVGNGFNFLIESIIRGTDQQAIPAGLTATPDEIATKIHNISILWEKFDQLFNQLKGNAKGLSDEELIRLIYAVLDFFSNLEGLEKVISKDKIEDLKKTFEFLLIDQIKEIADEFRQHEESEGYKNLKKMFPTFGQSFKTLMQTNSVGSCDIFTTNYDGILDTLLTGYPRGFLAVDGFGRIAGDDRYLKLYDVNLYGFEISCLHIHGSYKFEKKNGNTFKTKGNSKNEDPVIVFNNPNQKEELIKRDQVLKEYFDMLSHSLENSTKLIILGNSMASEPHLKNQINKHFNTPEKLIYACSRTPGQIALELNTYYGYQIHLRPTNGINSAQGIIDFLDEIIKHQGQ